jgi:polysaccharide export outer membrane protein
MLRKICAVTALIALTACGSVYRSSMVDAGLDDGTNVRVIKMTGETVVQANRSPYQPQTLPAIFSQTAGLGTTGRGVGALPSPTFGLETPPSAVALRVPPAVNPGAYTIGVGDVVLLSTPSTGSTVDELSGLLAAQNSRQGYTVQDDGSVNIPNVGRVSIAGLTIKAAEDELFQRLVENQFDPTFSLEIAEFNSRRVSVGGAVGRPSVLSVGLQPVLLGEALASVGSVVAPDLDFATVRIYRDGTLYQIPVTTLYERGDLLNTRLVDGDAVFVDTGFELDRAQTYFEQQIVLNQARQQAHSAALAQLTAEVSIRRAQLNEARANYQLRRENGANNRDYVYLAGEVDTQSRFALPFENTASLADAVFDNAGGIASETGDVSQIYVLRASDDPRDFGVITAWHLDARNAANFAMMTDFELRPDDVIFVAQQPITRWNRAISQMLPTLLTAANLATN